MAAANNPVMQCLDHLRDRWLEAGEDPQWRVLVWRVPDNATRLLEAFFAAQQQPETASTPDLFLRFDAPFETGFGYSRALKDALLLGYAEGRDDLDNQDIPIDWNGAFEQHPDTPVGFLALLDSFARHHREHLRHVAAVLMPESTASAASMIDWLDAALQSPIPEQLRLVVADTQSHPRWQALVERHPRHLRLIETPIDLFDVARATAAQSGAGHGSGPAATYRQLLADCMRLLDCGTAAQVAQRADRALQLAEREQWPDQQVVMHMLVAGAYLKEQAYREAIVRYRCARKCAQAAQAQGHPAGSELVMQSWFGEASALVAAKQLELAAKAYVDAAQAAKAVPNALFVIEGYRMAGQCLAQDRQTEPAREHYMLGLAEARGLDSATRAVTTFPLLLQDLLKLQDTPRAERIARTAASYKTALERSRSEAEAQAAKLGDAPLHAELEQVDARMLARWEASYTRLIDEREKLIGGGDIFFRKVVSVARELLHPGWNGLPEVRHPLDKALPEWSDPPAFLALPGGDDLHETPLVPVPDAPSSIPIEDVA